MAQKRKVHKLNFAEVAAFVAATNPFAGGDTASVLASMEATVTRMRRDKHGQTHSTAGFDITMDKSVPGETWFIASVSNYHLAAALKTFTAGVAMARSYMEIASDVTARGTTAKPSMKQLNELLDMAKAIDDSMNAELQRRLMQGALQ